jgi:hypothetical protein
MPEELILGCWGVLQEALMSNHIDLLAHCDGNGSDRVLRVIMTHGQLLVVPKTMDSYGCSWPHRIRA